MAIAGGVLAFGALAMALLDDGWRAVGVLLGGAIMLPLAIGLRYLIAARNVRSRDMSLVFDDPRKVAFSYDGIMVRTEGGIESKVPWTHIRRVERRGGFVLLFLGKVQHLIVADSAFQSESDREAFRSLVQARGLASAGGR